MAIALPVNVVGFFLLRLAKNLKQVALEQVTMQAFQEVGFTTEELGPTAVSSKLSEKKRAESMLAYSYTLLMFGALLTVVCVTAALWHLSWWIGVAFVVASVVGQFIVSRAVITSGSNLRWRPLQGGKKPNAPPAKSCWCRSRRRRPLEFSGLAAIDQTAVTRSL